ncbi:hypothetical protein OCU04_009846 [Sclerotinia nivalis]|uniref:Uncharacterized protein n=1 Tax=Sclerotinia nivalis TaxID=352851 RepID=A0A9X0AFX0_9HELO|nr:hypothetical protein OCU04_009846 [Sclerotinia nivalis]
MAYSGLTLAGFGASAGFFALFFFSDIPKVRNDIMVVSWHISYLTVLLLMVKQKIPIIGDRWRREVPASDNVRLFFFMLHHWNRYRTSRLE